MQWFKKHPLFLRDESTKLSNDSNYKEVYQCRNNLFLSHGDILVRLDKLYRYPILVAYTDATPFQLPAIFPLQKNLSEEEIDALSLSETFQLYEKIKPLILYYPHLRHQNGSGALCFLERESFENDNDFYGITTILKRVKEWHVGHITGNYPPDGEEVDFCAHFNHVNENTKLIYTKQFLDSNIVEGDAYAAIYKSIPKTTYLPFQRSLFYSSYMDGINRNGLIVDLKSGLENFFIDDRIKNSLDIVQKGGVIEELVDAGLLIKGQWFQIDAELTPFASLNDLVATIGNGNFDTGIERLVNRCQETFSKIRDVIYIGIRYYSKKGLLQFQLFKIYRRPAPSGTILSSTDKDRILNGLQLYEKVEAIRCERVTDASFHQRNSSRADYEILKKSNLNVFGVGALGSEVADCMAKAGIGEITLVDDQQLNVHNAVRHLAGIDMTDEFKVFAVAEIIHQHNQFIRIRPLPFNLFGFNYQEWIKDNSLSVSSVADDSVEGFVNQQMVIDNRTVFYARALRGGKAARIFRVIPGKDACFYCLNLYRREGKEFIEVPEDPQFPTLKNECNNPIRPGSAADLKFIASLTAKLLLEHLQQKESEYNHWIWTSEVIEGTSLQFANQLHTQTIDLHPKCPYCNHDKRTNVHIVTSTMKQMQAMVEENPSIETGGVLAGEFADDGDIIITHASGPGPKAVRTSERFEKDIEFCQQYLDELFITSQRKIVYVGEWHSHPSSNNFPSGLDLKSLAEISIQKEYLTDQPAMIILTKSGEPSCTVHPAGKRFYFAKLSIK